jgi:tRNA G18 (ribose-2'-O)-methylase SpoU
VNRGYFQIGIYRAKTENNIGTLWRTAHLMGAAGIFTVGRRYSVQSSDTTKAWRHVPLVEYPTVDDLVAHLPRGCPLVGVELSDMGVPLDRWCAPERCCVLLGAEDDGLPPDVLARCQHVVTIPLGPPSLNVAVAGAIVMWERHRSLLARVPARRTA